MTDVEALTAEQQDLLADLSRQFDKVLEEALAGARSQPPLEPESYFDRNCQWCFLRARNWDVAAALEQMKGCLKWRMDTRPWEVKCNACTQDPITHTMRQVGWDAKGRPVMYSSFKQAKERWNVEQNMQHCTCCCETLVAQMRRLQVQQWSWVIDFEGFGMRDMAPRIAMAMGTLLQNYPERLHRIVFIDMPRLFQAAFQALKLVVDARTIGKVIFSAPHSIELHTGDWMSPPLLQWLTREMACNRQRYSGATERDARCYWIPALQGQHDSRGTDAFVSSGMFWSFAHGFAAPAGGDVGADTGGEVEVEAEHLGDAVHQDGVYTE